MTNKPLSELLAEIKSRAGKAANDNNSSIYRAMNRNQLIDYDVPRLVRALERANQDLTSITNIDKDNAKNLAQACLDDITKTLSDQSEET